MAEVELDNIDLEMIKCREDGFGFQYGRWKATQPIVEPPPPKIPEGWRACPHCGKVFKPNHVRQKYCEALCGRDAQMKRYTESQKAKRMAEGGAENG